jgi:hypothetical protein
MFLRNVGFLQEPHYVTSQKTPFFIVTTVKTSNLTTKTLVCICSCSLTYTITTLEPKYSCKSFQSMKCISISSSVSGLFSRRIQPHKYSDLFRVRFEVLIAVALKNAVFWDFTQCRSCNNRRLGGIYRLHHQGDKIRRAKSIVKGINRSTLRRNTMRASIAS